MTDVHGVPAEEVAGWLMTEHGYRRREAESALASLAGCDDDIKEAFAHWWRTGELGGPTVHGYDAAQIVAGRGHNPVVAFIYVDELRRAPEPTLRSLWFGTETKPDGAGG